MEVLVEVVGVEWRRWEGLWVWNEACMGCWERRDSWGGRVGEAERVEHTGRVENGVEGRNRIKREK